MGTNHHHSSREIIVITKTNNNTAAQELPPRDQLDSCPSPNKQKCWSITKRRTILSCRYARETSSPCWRKTATACGPVPSVVGYVFFSLSFIDKSRSWLDGS